MKNRSEKYRKARLKGYIATPNGDVFKYDETKKTFKKVKSVESNGVLGFNISLDNKKLRITYASYIYWYFFNELPHRVFHLDGDSTNNDVDNLSSCKL